MSLSSTTNRVSYTGNGAVSSYSYTFKIYEDADLLVTVRDTDGEETTLSLTTDYTVNGAGSAAGGTIDLVDSGQDWLDADGDLLSGYVLTIRRVLDLVQESDFRNQGAFYPEIHEDQFDKVIMIAQQLQDQNDRSLKMPETLDPSDFDATIPATIVGQGNRVIGTNADGDGVAVGPTFDTISGATASATAAAASASSAATSASNAATSATSASTSASSASTSATNAATSASAASTSATDAAASASSASTSASTATTQAGNASFSASAAADSEAAAEGFKDAAFTYAGNASTSATAAATSASNAATSATNASNSASAASTSATNAAASATAAAASAAAITHLWAGTSGGAANAQTLTPSPALSSYSAGVGYEFIAGFTNTGAATINVSAIGAKSLKTQAGNALPAGSIVSGRVYNITYDGTNFIVREVVSPVSSIAAKTAAYTVTAADDDLEGDATSAAFQFTLPSASTVAGRSFTFLKTDSTFNVITVSDGSFTKKLATQGELIEVRSNGTAYNLVRRYIPGTVTSYTPTSTWNTNCTHVGAWHREGQFLVVTTKTSLTGAPNNTEFAITIPSGLTIDTAAFAATPSQYYTTILGTSTCNIAGGGYPLYLTYYSTTQVGIVATAASGSYDVGIQLSTTVPSTWANTSYLTSIFKVPITNWES